jgi:L-alanine-DL-glutamate epimerase-like enolase superfamily enzyme
MRIRESSLFFLPVVTRVPLKFGTQTVTQVLCARVRIVVEDAQGRIAEGWGETPLSVAWVWPDDSLPYARREQFLTELCQRLNASLPSTDLSGHPLEISHAFQEHVLFGLADGTPIPHLATLLCFSPFDLALYDAYGNLHQAPVFSLLGKDHLTRDLSHYLEPSAKFIDRYPADFLTPRQNHLPVWHLVGGLDALTDADLTGTEPTDGYPVLLTDWIKTDGLNCLKIKLRGTDPAWDYDRLVRVGRIALTQSVAWLSADFNCTVTDPAVVCATLDRLLQDEPAIYARLLYVEQPFPYELNLPQNQIDVRSVTARKPLFLDESAHDWKFVRLGRELGWSSVALKTCKTLTGALLSLAWAKAHGMTVMVQDLTNPMLAQIPHVLLAAHAGTIMGVESNAMQFYPAASSPEASIHPGLYQRRHGQLDLSTLGTSGFGYRVDEIPRQLPEAAEAV